MILFRHRCDRCGHIGPEGVEFDAVQWADGWGHLCPDCVNRLQKVLGDFMNLTNPLRSVSHDVPDRFPSEWLS